MRNKISPAHLWRKTQFFQTTKHMVEGSPPTNAANGPRHMFILAALRRQRLNAGCCASMAAVDIRPPKRGGMRRRTHTPTKPIARHAQGDRLELGKVASTLQQHAKSRPKGGRSAKQCTSMHKCSEHAPYVLLRWTRSPITCTPALLVSAFSLGRFAEAPIRRRMVPRTHSPRLLRQ